MTAYEWQSQADDNPAGVKRRVITSGFTAYSFGISRITVPGSVLWRPLAYSFTVTNSATVSARQLSLQIQPDSATTFYIEGGWGPIESTTTIYTFVNGPVANASGLNRITTPIPDLILAPGTFIQIQVQGFQTGDTLTLQRLWVEEVFEQWGSPPPERVTMTDRMDELEHELYRLR